MLFMVIERFRDRDAKAVYRRFRDHGRGAPDGLNYLGSWIEANFERCFQVMECDDARLLQQWVAVWGDLIDFEIVPVVSSADTQATIELLLEGGGTASAGGAHGAVPARPPQGGRTSLDAEPGRVGDHDPASLELGLPTRRRLL